MKTGFNEPLTLVDLGLTTAAPRSAGYYLVMNRSGVSVAGQTETACAMPPLALMRRMIDCTNALAGFPVTSETVQAIQGIKPLLQKVLCFVAGNQFAGDGEYGTGTPYEYCKECQETFQHRPECEIGKLHRDVEALLALLEKK